MSDASPWRFTNHQGNRGLRWVQWPSTTCRRRCRCAGARQRRMLQDLIRVGLELNGMGRILQSAVGPQRVQPSLEADGGVDADVALEDFPVAAHRPDDVVRPVGAESQLLPDCLPLRAGAALQGQWRRVNGGMKADRSAEQNRTKGGKQSWSTERPGRGLRGRRPETQRVLSSSGVSGRGKEVRSARCAFLSRAAAAARA